MKLPDQVLTVDPNARLFYDRAFAKWLPTPRSNVSPDGKRYAYYADSDLHVVDVATGVDRLVHSGGPANAVVDYGTAGVFVSVANARTGGSQGLWLQDPSGGQPKLIISEIVDPAVEAGAAWGLHFNAADPSPEAESLEGPLNEVLRFDLHTGASTPWYYRPGAGVRVLGFDSAGRAFVRTYTVSNATEPNELWLLQSPGQGVRLFAGSVPDPSQLGAVDGHGVWFDSFRFSPSTVWLYASGSLQRVATVFPRQVTNGNQTWIDLIDLMVAGGCIP